MRVELNLTGQERAKLEELVRLTACTTVSIEAHEQWVSILTKLSTAEEICSQCGSTREHFLHKISAAECKECKAPQDHHQFE